MNRPEAVCSLGDSIRGRQTPQAGLPPTPTCLQYAAQHKPLAAATCRGLRAGSETPMNPFDMRGNPLIHWVCAVAMCSGPATAAGQLYEVRDSAGVTLSMAEPASDVPPGMVRPELTIGVADGGEAYLFSQVWSAHRLDDGSIVVVEGRTYEVRVYDPTGEHLSTFGGQGGGPEEFGGPPWVAPIESGQLLVWDPARYFLTRYARDGELLDQVNRGSDVNAAKIRPFPNGLTWQIAPSGDLLWTGPAPRGGISEGINEFSSELKLIASDGTWVDLGDWPSSQSWTFRHETEGGFRGVANPLAPWTASALSRSHVAIGHPSRWEVRLHDHEGVLVHILRARLPRTEVNGDVVQRFRPDFERWSEGMRVGVRQLEEVFDQLPLPDSVPAIGHLLWDADGVLWVGKREAQLRRAHEYHIFATDGRWLGWVQLPEEVEQVLEVGRDYILAVIKDEFDVQYVRMYSVEGVRP